MDDQGQKKATIDDLLTELTKGKNPGTQVSDPLSLQDQPSSIPTPPKFNPPGPTMPSSPNPTPSPRPPMGPPPPPKEYQSSIRTMGSDLGSIKSGQKPAGIEIPRKIEPSTFQPAPTPLSPKPQAPGSSFKIPSVQLGQTEKTRPLTPPSPSVPSFPPKKEPVPSGPSIAIPEVGARSGVNRWVFIGIAGILVVLGVAYWFFFLRPGTPVVVETPTPTVTPSETPAQTLSSYFAGETQSVILPSSGDAVSFFLQAIKTDQIQGGSFKQIIVKSVIGTEATPVEQSLPDVLSRFLISLPDAVKNNLNPQGSAILVYGQKESFNASGGLIQETVAKPRLVLISEVTDSSPLLEGMTNWEPSLTSSFKSLFEITWKKSTPPTFLDNTYGGVAIRYANFNYPDKSIDFGVVQAANNKSYLVIADSREAIFTAIDRLKVVAY